MVRVAKNVELTVIEGMVVYLERLEANDGFYYSSYDKPEGSELSAKTDQHKLYYHKLLYLSTLFCNFF